MSSLVGAPWPEVIEQATASLRSKDEERLAQVDTALHAHFYEALRGGEAGRAEFIDQVLRIVDARTARPVGRGLDPAARAVTVWRHLMSVMQGVRRGVDRVERARIFLDTREHSRRLLELVRKAPKGIEFGELQKQLHMQKSNVSRLAREMEELGLIERVRLGNSAVYLLGLQGSLLAEEPAAAATADRVLPEGLRPLRNPRLALCA